MRIKTCFFLALVAQGTFFIAIVCHQQAPSPIAKSAQDKGEREERWDEPNIPLFHFYALKEQDSLESVATAYQMSVDQLLAINHLGYKHVKYLHPGDCLLVK